MPAGQAVFGVTPQPKADRMKGRTDATLAALARRIERLRNELEANPEVSGIIVVLHFDGRHPAPRRAEVSLRWGYNGEGDGGEDRHL